MKIVNHSWAVVLTCLLLFTSIRATLNFAYYAIDPAGFIEQLCENKERPELQCAGKCQLKKVAESQDHRQNTPESTFNLKDLLLFVIPQTRFYDVTVIRLNIDDFSLYNNQYSYDMVYSCFHPPELLGTPPLITIAL